MLINRDPFARQELHRETIHLGSEAPSTATCAWCGNVRRNARYPGNPPTLYQYSAQSDGGRIGQHKGLFCCKSCHDSYHS